MNVLRLLPLLTLSSLLLTHCRMSRPTIEDSPSSSLSDVAVGNLDKPSWATFELKLERLRPTTETIQRSYKRASGTVEVKDTTVQVAYGVYQILLTYRDQQNAIVFASCASEKSKEHKIDVPQYTTQIQVCASGQTTPAGVVKADTANVNIKPILIPPTQSGSFVGQHGLLTVAQGKIVDNG
jgi:hypothetical protein